MQDKLYQRRCNQWRFLYVRSQEKSGEKRNVNQAFADMTVIDRTDIGITSRDWAAVSKQGIPDSVAGLYEVLLAKISCDGTGAQSIAMFKAPRACIVTSLVVRTSTATNVTVTPLVHLEIDSVGNLIASTDVLTDSTSTLYRFLISGANLVVLADQTVNFVIDTEATADALTLVVELFGYLV